MEEKAEKEDFVPDPSGYEKSVGAGVTEVSYRGEYLS